MPSRVLNCIPAIELLSINIVSGSVSAWLITFHTDYSNVISGLVGISVIALNLIKIYKTITKDEKSL